jgi:pentatricopeptide repeat protein
MRSPAYFDTSVLIEATAKNGKVDEVRALLRELRSDKVRIYTSIITVQEASVLAFRHGGDGMDLHGEISNLARIVGVTRDIAVEAARMEAQIRDHCKENPEESESKQRRRWDCFHLASAVVLGCRHFYTTDRHFATRKSQLGLTSLTILKPISRVPTLPFSATPKSTKKVIETEIR